MTIISRPLRQLQYVVLKADLRERQPEAVKRWRKSFGKRRKSDPETYEKRVALYQNMGLTDQQSVKKYKHLHKHAKSAVVATKKRITLPELKFMKD